MSISDKLKDVFSDDDKPREGESQAEFEKRKKQEDEDATTVLNANIA